MGAGWRGLWRKSLICTVLLREILIKQRLLLPLNPQNHSCMRVEANAPGNALNRMNSHSHYHTGLE